jgi:biopolymer transport protein ExbD
MRLPRARPRRSADWQLQLINIVFLLLLFFITNGTISNIRDARIELPVSVAVAESASVGDAAYLDREGELRFRGERHKPEEIARLWSSSEGGTPHHLAAPFQLLVDRRLDARHLIEVLQALRTAGFLNISVVTLRESGHAP